MFGKFPLAILIIRISFSFCFHWKSATELWDLEFTGAAFLNEIASWAASNLMTPGVKHLQCGSIWMMGGYNILGGTLNEYFERTYTGLPAHNQLELNFVFFAIDSWDGINQAQDDYIQVSVDGFLMDTWRLSMTDTSSYISPWCGGSSFSDFPPIQAYSTFIHSSTTSITLKFISKLSQDTLDESFGIRDIKMKFTTVATPQNTLCGISPSTPLPNMFCPCDSTNKYMNPFNSGSCYPCDSTCATCTGPAASQCTTCLPNWFMVGSSCYPTCDPPFTISVSGGVTYCNTPCPGLFAWPDQSCSTNCIYSNAYGSHTLNQATINTFGLCKSPCAANQIISWNTSCLASCPEPLTNTLYGGLSFCDFTCGSTSSQHLYFNGSCFNDCSAPFLLEVQGSLHQKRFCWFPCPPGEYLYPDGQCFPPDCFQSLSPFVSRGYGYCNYKCTEPFYYFHPDASCKNPCPQRYFKDEVFRNCEACQDPFCLVCDIFLGEKCDVCQEKTILNSDGICKECDKMESEFIKIIDYHIYQYKIKLSPDSCDLNDTVLQDHLLPTSSSKNSLPPFSKNITIRENKDGKYYILLIDFNGSIAEDTNLDLRLSHLKTILSVPMTPDNSTFFKTLQTALTAMSGGTLVTGLIVGSTAGAWSMLSFQQFIGHFAYINIKFPKHLDQFLSVFLSEGWEQFVPNPFEHLINIILKIWDSAVDPKEYQLPNKFKTLETQTLFVPNSGSTFFSCLLVLILPFFFDFLRRFRRFRNIKFLASFHSSLRWNIPIRIFLEGGIPLFFDILIQMRRLTFLNVPCGISSGLACLALLYAILMLQYIFLKLLHLKDEKLKDPNIENSVGTLYEGIQMKKYQSYSRYYYLIILLRGLVQAFLNTFVDHEPVAQVLVLIGFNIFLACYIVQFIEFESKYLTWTAKIKEVIIFMAEIFILALYGQDKDYKNIVGWIIIVMLGFALLLDLLYAFYLQVTGLKELYGQIRDLYKKIKKKQKIVPVVKLIPTPRGNRQRNAQQFLRV